jgi:cell division septal protein FtsQ
MDLTHTVYLIIVIVFLVVVTYWILYTTRLKARDRTIALKGRPPISKEEGIAVATLEKERAGKSGSI